MEVILDDGQEGELMSLGDLLPAAFGPRNLESARDEASMPNDDPENDRAR
jgi:hypothetical protein